MWWLTETCNTFPPRALAPAKGSDQTCTYRQCTMSELLGILVTMTEILIGTGELAGKGVYADRDFKKGDVVIQYNLVPLTEVEYAALPHGERMFTHIQGGTIYLYSDPERYVNHSTDPNTYQDHTLHADIALCDIVRGEMITTDARKDDTE